MCCSMVSCVVSCCIVCCCCCCCWYVLLGSCHLWWLVGMRGGVACLLLYVCGVLAAFLFFPSCRGRVCPRIGVYPSNAHATAGFPRIDIFVKRALSDGVRSVPDVGAGLPGKNVFAKRSMFDGASTTSQMIRPTGSDHGSETASVDAGEVTSGMIQDYDWELGTAAQEVCVADGGGADGFRNSFLLPFVFSASVRSSKVTFRSRCATGLRHPHRSGEACTGSSGFHRRWSRLAENVHSAHGSYPEPAACLNLFPLARPDGRCRSTLGRLAAQLSRQWSPGSNVCSTGVVCARRVNNRCTSRTPQTCSHSNVVNRHLSK